VVRQDERMAGARPLFILAMDHRDSLERDVYGLNGEPSATDVTRLEEGKNLVFDGLLEALAQGVDASMAGVLVDERYGATVARRARGAGIDLAMPIERSGRPTFELEYGTFDDGVWLEHVQAFRPDQVKVLVRDNPDHPGAQRQVQFERLAHVSAVLRAAGRVFLVELLVPATDEQLAGAGGDSGTYDTQVRPGLTVDVIGSMYAAGVEPHIWKIEGLETAAAAEQIVAAARSGGRDAVRCIVLGRDAPQDRLDHWLEVAAPVDGFIGFAIGRSIWERPLLDHVAGRISAAELTHRVATAYTHFVRLFETAAAGA
jgi:myo-inositol catabolism protein IolC